MDGIRKILKKDKVQNSTVFLDNITGSAILVNVDYFSAAVNVEEFNAIKEHVNLDVLRLMEKMGLSIAGSSTTITVTNPEPHEPAPGASARD